MLFDKQNSELYVFQPCDMTKETFRQRLGQNEPSVGLLTRRPTSLDKRERFSLKYSRRVSMCQKRPKKTA